ncbi:MAG: Endonuclease/exonuclease/phosphatase [Solirubrobacterales bacterium]|nr:Endonuclease/exonuclease/phosphatase [Solirubrobacterales bacterium]
MRVLTWNLFHGRSRPPAGRELRDEFAALLAGWSWDVAMLQEVPPWWSPHLARACAAEHRTALTSRNSLLPLRRALARRLPDLAKSNGGGANALLARAPVDAARAVRLRTWPERRVAQIATLAGGTVVANFHASTRVPLAEQELARMAEITLDCAGGAPVVLGGDLNLRAPRAPSPLRHVAARDVDHLFAAHLRLVGEPRLHDRRVSSRGQIVELSDHPPLEVELA